MAQVNVTINGRQFRMACEDGQEEHLLQLAEDLDERIDELRGKFGEIGDTRLTVMAALTVADELAEAGKKMRRLEEELAALQDARVVAADRAPGRRRLRIVARFNVRRRAHRRHRQEAQPDRRRAASGDGGSSAAGGDLASAAHYIGRAGLRGAFGVQFPGALRSSTGAVPGRARGLGHMAPTYLCRFPGSALRRPSRLRTLSLRVVARCRSSRVVMKSADGLAATGLPAWRRISIEESDLRTTSLARRDALAAPRRAPAAAEARRRARRFPSRSRRARSSPAIRR